MDGPHSQAGPPQPPSPSPAPGRSPAVAGLLALAVLYTLYLAAEIVLPVLVAGLLSLVLTPVVLSLKRHGLPRGLAAGLVTALLVAGIGWGVSMLAEPAAGWLERAPQSIALIERKLRPVREPVEKVVRATEHVERLAGTGDEGRAVTVNETDLGAVFVISATTLAAQALIVVVLVFFLLATGDRLIRRAARVPRRPEGRRRVVAVARRIKQDVSIYLALITLVNIGLGVVTGLAMWALGMPTPALWGVMAGVMNYVPYLGSIINLVVFSIVGLLSFDDIWRAVLPAVTFLALTTIEADFVTPMVVGRRLTLPPLMVFLSLIVWGWMWGVVGALLAVPILVVTKVIADNLPSLRPLAAFLGPAEANRSLKVAAPALKLKGGKSRGEP